MSTGPQQKRKELREKRLKAEAAAKSGDRRQNLTKIVGAAAFVAVVAIVVAIVALSSGGNDSAPKDPAAVNELLAGIPQNGTVLGEPDAKVTLVEFGDLQCPVCKQYAEQILPDVIKGPVRDGDVNFDFQNWAILGEDSTIAAKAMLAAAEQNKGWEFMENFYAEQGLENTGYVDDDFLTDVAEKAGVPDLDRFNADREDDARADELLAIDELATAEGFTGTPSFAIRKGDGPLTPLNDTQSSEAIIKALKQAQN